MIVTLPVRAMVVFAAHPAGPTESSVMLPSSSGPDTVVRRPVASSAAFVQLVAVATSVGTTNSPLAGAPTSVVGLDPGYIGKDGGSASQIRPHSVFVWVIPL